MRYQLRSRKLWKLVKGEEKLADGAEQGEKDAFDEKCIDATMRLTYAMSPAVVLLVQSLDCPVKIWDRLAGIIGGVLRCQQVYSQPSMVQYTRQYTRWYRYQQTQLLEDNGYLYRTKGCVPICVVKRISYIIFYTSTRDYTYITYDTTNIQYYSQTY